jgi:hypothetical protein
MKARMLLVFGIKIRNHNNVTHWLEYRPYRLGNEIVSVTC